MVPVTAATQHPCMHAKQVGMVIFLWQWQISNESHLNLFYDPSFKNTTWSFIRKNYKVSFPFSKCQPLKLILFVEKEKCLHSIEVTWVRRFKTWPIKNFAGGSWRNTSRQRNSIQIMLGHFPYVDQTLFRFKKCVPICP